MNFKIIKYLNHCNSARGEIIQFFSILLSGLATIMYKISLSYYSFENFILLNSLICTFICATFVLYRNLSKKYCPPIVDIGLCGKLMVVNAFALCTYFGAIYLLHPAAFVLFTRFFVIFSFLSSYFYLKESASMEEAILLLILLCGGFCIAYDHEVESLMLNFTGVGFAVFSSFFFSVYYSLVAKKTECTNRNYLIAVSHLFSYIILVTLSLLIKVPETIELNLFFKNIEYILLIIFANIFIFSSLFLFFRGAEFSTFRYSMAMRSLTPLIVLALSWPIFPLKLNAFNIVGFIASILVLFRLSYIRHFKKP